MESNVVFLSEVRNAMSQALWQKKPIKYPLWYKLLTGPGQVVRFTKNSYEMIPFSESKTSTKFLQILQTEIQSSWMIYYITMDTLLSHETTGEELWTTVKWQKWCW